MDPTGLTLALDFLAATSEKNYLPPILLGLAASITTLLGGLTAAKITTGKNLVMAVAAGLMLGVVFFDLIPESIEQAGGTIHNIPTALIAVALGFLTFHFLEKLLGSHPGHEAEYSTHTHTAKKLGLLAGSGLVMHSLLDGFGIGAAFQIGSGVGISVAVAVIAHDFADGFNAFTLPRIYGNNRKRAYAILAADAAAPLTGALIATLITVPSNLTGLYLGYFAGVLLYLATAEVLPQAHATRSNLALFLTTASMAFMWLIVGYAG